MFLFTFGRKNDIIPNKYLERGRSHEENYLPGFAGLPDSAPAGDLCNGGSVLSCGGCNEYNPGQNPAEDQSEKQVGKDDSKKRELSFPNNFSNSSNEEHLLLVSL